MAKKTVFKEANHVISVDELKTVLKQEKHMMLIDVRLPEEHHIFNIGGKLIPLTDLEQRLHEIDLTKTIITYCRSGQRSLLAAKILMEAGASTVKSLTGGVIAWQQSLLKELS